MGESTHQPPSATAHRAHDACASHTRIGRWITQCILLCAGSFAAPLMAQPDPSPEEVALAIEILQANQVYRADLAADEVAQDVPELSLAVEDMHEAPLVRLDGAVEATSLQSVTTDPATTGYLFAEGNLGATQVEAAAVAIASGNGFMKIWSRFPGELWFRDTGAGLDPAGTYSPQFLIVTDLTAPLIRSATAPSYFGSGGSGVSSVPLTGSNELRLDSAGDTCPAGSVATGMRLKVVDTNQAGLELRCSNPITPDEVSGSQETLAGIGADMASAAVAGAAAEAAVFPAEAAFSVDGPVEVGELRVIPDGVTAPDAEITVDGSLPTSGANGALRTPSLFLPSLVGSEGDGVRLFQNLLGQTNFVRIDAPGGTNDADAHLRVEAVGGPRLLVDRITTGRSGFYPPGLEGGGSGYVEVDADDVKLDTSGEICGHRPIVGVRLRIVDTDQIGLQLLCAAEWGQ